MPKSRITFSGLAVGLLLGLSACTNPYDPVQRTIGGGLIGAGSGAAIGAGAGPRARGRPSGPRRGGGVGGGRPRAAGTGRPLGPRWVERLVQWAALSQRRRRSIATRADAPP